MKKLQFIVLFLCIHLVPIFSQEFTITPAFLKSNHFSFSHMMATAFVIFADSTYEIKYASEGIYWYNRGYYQIKNNTIYFTPTKCSVSEDSENIDCNNTFGSGECRIIKPGNDLYFEYYLECKSYQNTNLIMPNTSIILFPVIEYPTRPNIPVTIDNISAITIGNKKAVTTDNLNYRVSPSIQATKKQFLPDLYSEPLEFIPKNIPISILARTIEKVEINGFIDYWYYIYVNGYNGWAFGVYIKFLE